MNTSVESAAGYAKFETFPIWNIPLKHPVNLAYEAATADLNDVNMIDPFHLEAYGETTVNYNRDVEIFPVLQAMFEKIMGDCPYKSPTDMGVNMAETVLLMTMYAARLPSGDHSSLLQRAAVPFLPAPVRRKRYAKSSFF